MAKRPIPDVDQFTYMLEHPHDPNQGVLRVIDSQKHHRLQVEMAHCTAYLDQQEAFKFIVAYHQAACQQWPGEWQTLLEVYFNHAQL